MKRLALLSFLALLAPALAYSQPLANPKFIDLVRTGTAAQVEAAIKAGENVNGHDRHGITLLMFAVAYNSDAAVTKTLLSAGANVQARDEIGDTPLMWAAAGNSNPEVIKLLLAAGAHVSERNYLGDTALMWAAGVLGGNPHPEITKLLIQDGAQINARNDLGMTPLILAARSNQDPAVVAALLAAGADPALKSSEGLTAYQYASENFSFTGSPVLKQLEAAAP
jgi:ankyrin repeat protein